MCCGLCFTVVSPAAFLLVSSCFTAPASKSRSFYSAVSMCSLKATVKKTRARTALIESLPMHTINLVYELFHPRRKLTVFINDTCEWKISSIATKHPSPLGRGTSCHSVLVTSSLTRKKIIIPENSFCSLVVISYNLTILRNFVVPKYHYTHWPSIHKNIINRTPTSQNITSFKISHLTSKRTIKFSITPSIFQ